MADPSGHSQQHDSGNSHNSHSHHDHGPHHAPSHRTHGPGHPAPHRWHGRHPPGRLHVHVLPKAGHWVQVDNPAGLLDLMAGHVTGGGP